MNEELFRLGLKTLFINLFILLVDFKIIDKKITKTNFILMLFASIFIAILYVFIQRFIDKLLIIIISYFIQLKFLELALKNDNNGSLMIMNLISNSIIYIVFVISTFIESIFIIILNLNNRTINLILIIIIEAIILFLIFRIKRFRHGLSFVKNSNNEYFNIIMINISSVVILAYYIFGNYYGDLTEQLIACLVVIAFIMLLVIQKTLTLYYKQKLFYK